MLYGYARVSSDGQTTAAQVAALRSAGCRRIVEETRSGVLELVELERLVLRLRPGDTLLVWKLDRLGRSLRSLLALVDDLTKRGVHLRSVCEPLDTSTAVGRAFVALLCVFAELERGCIRERCEAGRRAARDRGVLFGRPPLLREAEVRALSSRGLTGAQAARAAGVSRSALYRAAAKYSVPFRDGRGGVRVRSV